MADTNETRASLLVRIRDAENRQAWSQFVDLYAPLIYGFARKHALQAADVADLTQDVLRAVARSVKQWNYDPERGTFRGWLFTVARNELRDFLAQQKRHPQGTGESSVQEQLQAWPDPTVDESAEWEAEHERRLFAWVAEQVRGEVHESTWRAFWQTAVEGRNGKDVAQELGLTIAAVYLAKSRVMARIKVRIKAEGQTEQLSQLHDELVKLCESRVEIAEVHFKNGVMPQLELSQARKELINARIQREAARQQVPGSHASP